MEDVSLSKKSNGFAAGRELKARSESRKDDSALVIYIRRFFYFKTNPEKHVFQHGESRNSRSI